MDDGSAAGVLVRRSVVVAEAFACFEYCYSVVVVLALAIV